MESTLEADDCTDLHAMMTVRPYSASDYCACWTSVSKYSLRLTNLREGLDDYIIAAWPRSGFARGIVRTAVAPQPSHPNPRMNRTRKSTLVTNN
jgi:hypothetical protein